MSFLHKLPDSFFKEKLTAVEAVYAEADKSVDEFGAASSFCCSFGCGSCCETFIPDVLPVEASYIAAYIALEAPETAQDVLAWTPEELARYKSCRLFNPNSPYHCGVYKARPLICRLFAYSGIRDKYGSVSFSVCKYMRDSPRFPGERRFGAIEADARFSVKPPIMSSFGESLVLIEPHRGTERDLVHRLLPSALSEALYITRLASGLEARD